MAHLTAQNRTSRTMCRTCSPGEFDRHPHRTAQPPLGVCVCVRPVRHPVFDTRCSTPAQRASRGSAFGTSRLDQLAAGSAGLRFRGARWQLRWQMGLTEIGGYQKIYNNTNDLTE